MPRLVDGLLIGRGSISVALARNALLAGLALSFALGTVQFSQEMERARERLDDKIRGLMATVLESSAHAAYNIDQDMARQAVIGLFGHNEVRRVEIVDDFDTVLTRLERSSTAAPPGWLMRRLASWQSTYMRELAIRDVRVGRLEVQLDMAVAGETLWNRLSRNLAWNLASYAILGGLLTIIFHFSLARPLLAIRQGLSEVDPEAREVGRLQAPRRHERDELGQIVATVNALLTRIETELDRRNSVEKVLRSSEEEFRLLVEHQSDIVVRTGAEGLLRYVSPSFCDMFGGRSAEHLGRHVLQLVAEPDREKAMEALMTVSRPPYRAFLEARFLTPEGERWLGWTGKGVLNDKGEVSEIIAVGRDVTERREADHRIQSQLREKETLLKEVHHRVKNNLQIVSSLLNLQLAQARDETVRDVFQKTQNRIRSIAGIHESLYRSEDLSRIEFGVYLERLVKNIRDSMLMQDSSISIEVRQTRMFISIEQAVPLGLIASELVSNALRHAFPGGGPGRVTVNLESAGARGSLSVRDNGVGMERTTSRPDSLGMELVRALVGQLEGVMDFLPGEGTHVRVRFTIRDETV